MATLISGCINVASPVNPVGLLVRPNAGPYLYDGKLFVFGYVELGEQGETASFGVWRSGDDGATWASVGGAIALTSLVTNGALGLTVDGRGFAVCQSSDGRYLYALYLQGAFAGMRCSKFDCSAEAWIASSDGPDLRTDDHNQEAYFLAEDPTTGDLHIIANVDTNGAGVTRVQRAKIPAAFGAWTGFVDVDGPFAGSPPYQIAEAAVTGSGGAVHGIFVDADGFELRSADITAGSHSTLAYSSTYDNIQPNMAAASRPLGGDQELLLVAADQGASLLQLTAVTGLSGGGSFASAGLGVDEDSSIQTVVFRSGSDVILFYRLGAARMRARRWTGDPGAWAADTEFPQDINGVSGGGLTAHGYGVTYSVGSIGGGGANLDTWFDLVSLGGPALTLTGAAGIPSGEEFGQTSGLRGGGGPTCGPAGPNPIEPGCSPSDPVAPPVSTTRCGYAMAI